MSYESAFNLLWTCLSLCALALLIRSELCRDGRRGSTWQRIGRLLTLVLAIIFLFPCISASDDLLTVQDLAFTIETRGEAGTTLPHRNNSDGKPGPQLARLFENLQNFNIASPFLLSIAPVWFALIALPGRPVAERFLECRGGRAPPVSALS